MVLLFKLTFIVQAHFIVMIKKSWKWFFVGDPQNGLNMKLDFYCRYIQTIFLSAEQSTFQLKTSITVFEKTNSHELYFGLYGIIYLAYVSEPSAFYERSQTIRFASKFKITFEFKMSYMHFNKSCGFFHRHICKLSNPVLKIS